MNKKSLELLGNLVSSFLIIFISYFYIICNLRLQQKIVGNIDNVQNYEMYQVFIALFLILNIRKYTRMSLRWQFMVFRTCHQTKGFYDV